MIWVTKTLGWLGGRLGDAASTVVMAPINALASAVADGVQSMLVTLGTAWVHVGVPSVTDGGGGTTVSWLSGELAWLAAAGLVLSLVIGGARMAWEQRADPGRDVLRGLLTYAVVSGCGVAGLGLAFAASDALAEHLVASATSDGGFGKNVVSLLALSGSAIAPILVIFLGAIAIVVSLLQVALLVLRAGLLVAMAAAWPLAASLFATPTGRAMSQRYGGWLLALILYKPAVAALYGVAFRLAGTRELSTDGLLSVLTGLALMVAALLAAPALAKLVVPAVGALSIGGGGGAGAATMAAGAAMPLGARMLPMGNAPQATSAAGGTWKGPTGANGAAGANGAGGMPSQGRTGPSGPNGASGKGSPAVAAPVASQARLRGPDFADGASGAPGGVKWQPPAPNPPDFTGKDAPSGSSNR